MKEVKQEDIELEASLLNALAIKKNYDQFIGALELKRLIPITASLLKDYNKYYEKHATDVDWSLFYQEFCDWHKKDLDEHDLAYYRETVFPLIRNAQTDKVYTNLLEREAKKEIENVLNSGYCHEKLHEILINLQTKKAAYTNEIDDDIFTLGSVDCSVLDTSKGLEWCLPSLQAGLGSLMPGQFIVVAADSDVGKSAFCITQAVHTFKMLHKMQQLDRPILYCTSEDTKEDLACRFLSNLYRNKIPGGFEEIVKKFGRVNEHYITNYCNDMFIGVSIRGPRDLVRIEQKISRYNPALITVDMLDKLSNSDNIQDLTRLYQDIRGIANDGYPIIGTSQTGNTTYQDKETKEYKHRKKLSDKDLSGSKAGKQGAAYCIISIGLDDDMPNIRYLATTKKKRGRHVQTTCKIDDVYSCYEEIL